MKHRAPVLPVAIGAKLVALYGAGKWSRLVIVADQVTARYPGHPLGWQASGKALWHLRRLPEAIERLSRVVKLAPDGADGHNDLGNALHDIGRVQEAVASYCRAVELNPDSSAAHSNLGRALCGLRRFEEAAASCRRAIDIDPLSTIAHNNLGNALTELDLLAEAAAAYRQSLALDPECLDAIINLGTVLVALSRWSEAKSAYRLAIESHPNAGVAHNALGRLLSRLCEDDDDAARCLERAISLNGYDINTYAELGNILMRKHQVDAALVMFRQAQKLQPFITWHANQARSEFSAVFLDTPMGGSTPVNYLAGKACYDRHFHCVIPDVPVNIDLLRSKADVVFNMISDVDDGENSLRLALDLVERLGRPTINHPRVVMHTDRETIARRLADIPYCLVPKTVRLPGPVVSAVATNGEYAGFRLPLLLRIAGRHGGDDFEKFDDWAAIADFISKSPNSNYYLTEYIDYRSGDGLFRKYRVIFIDGELFPYHLAIHDHWMVHHFRTDMANQSWMREEEERFLGNIGGVFTAGHRDALRAIASATELDLGGIDCGLDRTGRIVVFEVNASMLVHDEQSEEFAYKNQYVGKIKCAFDTMLSRRRAGH